MVNKVKYLVAAMTALSASSGAIADDMQGRLSIIYSPHRTLVSAPGYNASFGLPPVDHGNTGKDYYGLMGEINFAKISIAADYLRGTSDTVEGGTNYMAPTFNPVTHETAETFTLAAGYNILDNSVIGKMDATLGYFRMWASPAISPPNSYDGAEIGIKGRRSWDGGAALTYKLGYVPSVSVHGYLNDHNLMTGRNVLNYRIGAEIPVYKNISAIGGYQRIRLENRVVYDNSTAIVTFSGFYVGGMYSF